MSDDIVHKVSCHCGAFKYEFKSPAEMTAMNCNCTICYKSGFLHIRIPKEKLIQQSVSDWNAVENYKWGTGSADHYFCKKCGVSALRKPRSSDDMYTVNFHCVDGNTLKVGKQLDFDGREKLKL